ncbi:hypothetical protein [Microlunatus soli]|uniref:SPFH domain / Band 7 family protein n=1 Tax=Microlunatus soli TaxID=630515 RepID=A0A1H1SJ54_9ACTN|nr:hypothetical protein [Microlunatus soli]SDS48080.1 hypothetical protein SAMN04489812_2037 [Microlunatus soli]
MLPPSTLQSTHPAEHLLDGSEERALLLIVIIVLVLLSIGTIRLVPAGHRLVVLRRGVVRRTPRGRLVVVLPGRDQVVGWPTTTVDEALQVRSRTDDGAEVRVLAEVTLGLSPPQIGAAYAEPVGVAVEELSMIVEEAVAERDLDDLLDGERGLLPVLEDRRLDSGTKINSAVIAEIEVLLGDRVEGRR